MAYAAPGDTWGIPGPTFLIGFLAVAGILLILAVAHRRTLFAGNPGESTRTLGSQQAAYLNGGPRLAVYSALGGLRAAGVIGNGPHSRTLAQTGPLPSGVTPLDTAVYNAAGKGVLVRDLEADPWVSGALDQLRAGVERCGLVLSPERRRAARLWAVPFAALLVIGVLRAVAGAQHGRSIGFLVVTLVAVLVVTLIMVVRVPFASHAGTAALSRIRREQHHLAPDQHPSYAVYGASGAAMGVALYGAGSLWAWDPAFAGELDIQRATSNHTGSFIDGGSSCSSSGGGGGSSCGGGGSSCGGGGGCGG